MSTTSLTVAEKIRTLSTCGVFSGAPSGDLGVLAEMMLTERLGPAETLFERGEPSDRVYIVASGCLSVFVAGRAEPVRELGPGDVLGEYGLFAGLVRTATVKAGSEAVLLSLDCPRFRAFLLQFPEATVVLLRTAVERLVAAEARGGGHTPMPAG